MKVYYNKEKKLIIEDLSGIKPLNKIEAEFGSVEGIEIDEATETYKLLDGKLFKKVIEIPDNTEELLIQEEIRKLAKDSLIKQGKIPTK